MNNKNRNTKNNRTKKNKKNKKNNSTNKNNRNKKQHNYTLKRTEINYRKAKKRNRETKKEIRILIRISFFLTKLCASSHYGFHCGFHDLPLLPQSLYLSSQNSCKLLKSHRQPKSHSPTPDRFPAQILSPSFSSRDCVSPAFFASRPGAERSALPPPHPSVSAS